MSRFCFIHGWAYTPDIWKFMSQAWPGDHHTFLDLGFFGQKAIEKGDFDVVITHSYGLMWLLQNPEITYRKLVSISGISQYVKSTSQCIPKAQIRAMRTQLRKGPSTLLGNFYNACGDQNKQLSRTPNINRLHDALLDMEGHNLTDLLPADNVLALASTGDRITPAILTKEIFTKHRLVWHDSDSHILPITAPEWCVESIKDFIHA